MLLIKAPYKGAGMLLGVFTTSLAFRRYLNKQHFGTIYYRPLRGLLVFYLGLK
jgi:hypothetical protein